MTIQGGDLIALLTGGALESFTGGAAAAPGVVDDTFYNTMAVIAEELVEEFGRNVTFIRYDQSFTDTDKPWDGPTDPRAVPDESAIIRAVFVPPSGANALGLSGVDQDLLKRTSEICIVAPGVASPPFDLATANELIDDSVNKRVVFTETLAPADVTLLYFVGVER